MTIEEIKGHLIARKGNLTQHGQLATARMMQLEKELQAARGEVAATEGACQEIDRTLAVLDVKGAP